jgi:hypothetical protein
VPFPSSPSMDSRTEGAGALPAIEARVIDCVHGQTSRQHQGLPLQARAQVGMIECRIDFGEMGLRALGLKSMSDTWSVASHWRRVHFPLPPVPRTAV